MNSIEQQVVELVQGNKYLSEDLKKRYLVALFLMEYEKQEEYLKLLQAFTQRCVEMDRGIFIVHPQETGKLLKTYEQAKADILKKINPNNINNQPR